MPTADEAATEVAPEETGGNWDGFALMSTERSHFAAAADGDRLLYAVGGNSAASTAAEVWDAAAAADGWTVLPDMTVSRISCAAAVVDGKLFVVGGHGVWEFPRIPVHDSASAYDPTTRSWTDVPSMRVRRFGCAAAAFDGKVYVFGGRNHDDKHLSSVEVLDPVARTWTDLPPMNVGRVWCAAAVVGDRICVGGGEGGPGPLRSVEVFDPRRAAWRTSLPSMICWRAGCAAVGWDDRLYVFGGQRYRMQRSAEVFDFGAGAWSRLPDMVNRRRGCAAAVVDGRMIVMGGYSHNAYFQSCEAYYSPYHRRIDWNIAVNLPQHRKDQVVHVMMVARRLDDERAQMGGRPVGLDLWWMILGMLKVGDLC